MSAAECVEVAMRNTFHQPLCVYLVDRVETNTVRDQSFCGLKCVFVVSGKCVVKCLLPFLLAKHKDTISPSQFRAKRSCKYKLVNI